MNREVGAAAPRRKNGWKYFLGMLIFFLVVAVGISVYYSWKNLAASYNDIESYAQRLAQGLYQQPLQKGLTVTAPERTADDEMTFTNFDKENLKEILRIAANVQNESEISKKAFELWSGTGDKQAAAKKTDDKVPFHDIAGSFWRGTRGEKITLTRVSGKSRTGRMYPQAFEDEIRNEVEKLTEKTKTFRRFDFATPWGLPRVCAIQLGGKSVSVVVLEPEFLKWPFLLNQKLFLLMFCLVGFIGAFLLFFFCVRPLTDLAARTEKLHLRIGRELLKPGRVGPTAELNRVQNAIADLALRTREYMLKNNELRDGELNRQAEDRAQIAQDLHSGALAYFKGLRNWKEVVKGFLEDDPVDIDQLGTILDYMWSEGDKTDEETRKYLYENLNPSWMAPELSKMLENLTAKLNEDQAVRARLFAGSKEKHVTCRIEGDVDVFENGTVYALGGQIREAANNAFNDRSGASTVQISARRETGSDGIDSVVLRVHDDGVGIAASIRKQAEADDTNGRRMQEKLDEILLPDGTVDVVKLYEAGHHGLHGIKQAAEFLGGSACFASKPGEGTTITMRIPVPEKHAREHTN